MIGSGFRVCDVIVRLPVVWFAGVMWGGVCVVVQIFPWFKIFQTSLIFTFLCLKSITIIRDKEKQKLNWFEKF